MSVHCVIEVSAPVELLEDLVASLLLHDENSVQLMSMEGEETSSMKGVALNPARREELQRLKRSLTILDRIEVMGFASLNSGENHREGPVLEQIEKLTKDIQGGNIAGISPLRIASLRRHCVERIRILEGLINVLVGRYATTLRLRVPQEKVPGLTQSLNRSFHPIVLRRIAVESEDKPSWIGSLWRRGL